MAKYVIQGETLTAIADKIRVLSGTEDALSLNAMESHVGEANEDVTTEAELIAQITSALEGKAGGGSAEIAPVLVNASNGTTFYYIGENGLSTITNKNCTVDMVVPSLCYAYNGNGVNCTVTGKAEVIHYLSITRTIYVSGSAKIEFGGV